MKTIGVLGLGSIGARHAKNLQSLGCKVIGYDPVNLAEPNCYSVGGAVDDSDAVVIASPTDEHLHQLDYVTFKNKHVFIEKPIASSTMLGPFGTLHALAKLLVSRKKLVTMCGYNLRLHSCIKMARKWLDSNMIGEPLWANFTCAQYNSKPSYQRDGVILNWASHEIDLALYLLGPATVAAATTRITGGNEDITDFVLLHQSGTRSSHHSDYLTHPERRWFSIIGKYGAIDVDIVQRTAKLSNSDGFITETFSGTDTFDQNYLDEMKAFLSRIDGCDTIGASGEDGLRALEIALAIKKQSGL